MSGLSVFYFMLLLLLDATGISTWAPLTYELNRAKKQQETENKLDSQTECAWLEKHGQKTGKEKEKGR